MQKGATLLANNSQYCWMLYVASVRATRVITKSSFEVSSSPLLDGLGWKNLISNREKHKAILVLSLYVTLLQCTSAECFVNLVQIMI